MTTQTLTALAKCKKDKNYFGTYYDGQIICTNAAEAVHIDTCSDTIVHTVASKQAAENFHSIAVYEQYMYVISATYEATPIRVSAYDMQKRQWEFFPVAKTGPKNRANSSLIVRTSNVAHRELVIFGGFNKASMNDLWCYSLLSHSWRMLEQKNPVHVRACHACAYDAIYDTMILFSGFNGHYLKDFCEYSFIEQAWKTIPELNPNERPPAMYQHSMIAVGKHKFVIAEVRW